MKITQLSKDHASPFKSSLHSKKWPDDQSGVTLHFVDCVVQVYNLSNQIYSLENLIIIKLVKMFKSFKIGTVMSVNQAKTATFEYQIIVE